MKYTRFLLTALLLCATAMTMTSCGGSNVASPDDAVESAPPAAPGSVSMSTEAATGRDYLNWEPSASADVVGYQIFRFSTDSATTDGVLVGAVASDQVSAALPLVNSIVTEYYRVRARNSNDLVSSYSNNFTASRTAWDGEGVPSGSRNPNGRPTDELE